MENEKYIYYCDDCHCFVGKDHRCQQWSTVHMIPNEAVDKLQKSDKEQMEKSFHSLKNICDEKINKITELEKYIEDLKCCGNCGFYQRSTCVCGNHESILYLEQTVGASICDEWKEKIKLESSSNQ